MDFNSLFMQSSQRQGILLIVTGPSGSGKTTMCKRAKEEKQARYAISCTTRLPRTGEINGQDYHFLSPEEFKNKIKQGEFIEYAEVHGNFYGTLKSELLSHLQAGIDIVMDIDVQGAENIRQCDNEIIKNSLVDLFVMPEDSQQLRSRLTERATDSEEIINTRMTNAMQEITHVHKFTNLLLSKDKENDYNSFISLLIAERLKNSRIFHPNKTKY